MPTKRRRKKIPTNDLRLKIAIIQSRKTQRRVAIETRIAEVRLSAIVSGHGVPATAQEQRLLSKCLGRPIDELFAPEVIALAIEDEQPDVTTDHAPHVS
jgi:transcriptional regulator with XRE-family HTH domain